MVNVIVIAHLALLGKVSPGFHQSSNTVDVSCFDIVNSSFSCGLLTHPLVINFVDEVDWVFFLCLLLGSHSCILLFVPFRFFVNCLDTTPSACS